MTFIPNRGGRAMGSEAEARASDPKFLLFSGEEGRAALRLEGFHALSYAYRRMKERAQEAPGFYFVCCLETQEILASEDSSSAQSKAGRNTAETKTADGGVRKA
jgi:hypothetical protein